MFGVETEYALAAVTPEGKGGDRGRLLGELMRLAGVQIPSLVGFRDGDLYLQNGSRFYVDCGNHPELSTPECTNPWDVVRYIQAGERLLAGLCRQIESGGHGLREVALLKCNVDYSGAKSTWGSHESYLHLAEPAGLPRELIPHLVSRIIYAGAGGFNSLSPGLEFLISPRSPHLVAPVSDSSTSNRGIFHTKDESLCRGSYHRLHLLCGESLCSEIAAWLRVGTTALVVAMIEAGLRPGDGVDLPAPLEALHLFAGDPDFRAEVRCAGARRLTAAGIQRHYLEFAEAHLAGGFMPPWAPAVCQAWRELLARIEAAPRSRSRTCEWAIKLELSRERSRRRGIEPHTWPVWTEVVGGLVHALGETEYSGKPVRVEFVLGPDSPIRPAVERLTPILEMNALRWDLLRPFMDLRQELFEIDLRFGQIGERGIFGGLDRAGLLSHRVAGVDNIEHAMTEPPAEGRARLRGEVIRRFAGRSDVRCSWQKVWDNAGGKALDLNDPFERVEKWRKTPASERLTFHSFVRDLF
jgi:proteasome accessory factor A